VIRNNWTAFRVLRVFFILLFVLGLWVAWGVGKPRADAAADAALDEKVASFIHARFGWPDTVKVSANPFAASSFPGFLTATVTTDDGKKPSTNTVYLTSDRRYLVLGFLFALHNDPKEEIVKHIREQFKVPDSVAFEVGPFHNSEFPSFQAVTVSIENGKQKREFYVSKGSNILVLGDVYNLGTDLRRQALRTIVLTNQPSQGPEQAPVTIVEYGDLQCPMCGRLHEFLEKDLLPKYGDKVRVVFKEFPLYAIHDWSPTAAIANECVYQMKPEAFAAFRSLVFQNQAATNAANVRDSLLAYADQLGLDHLKLAGCMDAKGSLALVNAGAEEGKRLGITSTPTCFINGRMLVGFPSPEAYYDAVDAALKGTK
jgi:protein-disulfide isomerase